MTLHEVSFWTLFPRPTTVVLAGLMAVLSVIVFIIYAGVIKVLLKKTCFKNDLFYWILTNIAIIDFIYLHGITAACFMSLIKAKSFPLMYEIVSAIHAVYEWVLVLFCFMIALKLTLTTFRLEFRYSNAILKFLTLFIWKALMINLHITHAAGIEMVYVFDVINFSVDLSTPKARRVHLIFIYIKTCILVATLLFYCLIAGYHLLKKYKMLKGKLSGDCEAKKVFQGLATYLPTLIYFVLNSLVDACVPTASLALSLFMSVLPRTIPLFNLIGLLALNRDIRCALWEIIKSKLLWCFRRRCNVKSMEAKENNRVFSAVTVSEKIV